MNRFQSVFSDKYLIAQFKELYLPEPAILNEKIACIARWKKSLINQSILQSKEESLQGVFLQQFFVSVLEYSNQKDSGAWTLETEQKTLDNKKMDGALGFFKIENNALIADVRVVIELKNAKTDLDKPQNRKDDKRTPVQQAFDYANTLGGSCRWIIVSNFKEIRLYKQGDRTTYQAFDILTLDNLEKFKTFYLLLNKKRLISQIGDSLTDKLFINQQEEKLAISKRFYADYKQARFDVFHQLKTDFSTKDPLVLLAKTQKLLDRLIFIRFCESNAILVANTLKELIECARKDKFIRAKNKIFQRLHVFFTAIDKGDEPLAINKFNGGLFKQDSEFDELMTEDALLELVLKLVDYDFKSDLDVNILGHIFEQSLSDIEELKAEISGEILDKKQSKRKKDGIYYTPDYITHYIVEETIGGWLKERRAELNEADLPELSEADWLSIAYITKGKEKGAVKWNTAIQTHIDFYQAYQKIVSNIKVLDPACGSGAFLNQAFDFLYTEGVRVNKRLAELMYPAEESQFNVLKLNEKLEQHILNDNLFGVDLNEESVEITRLSLWIKTANRRDELTTLDENIKCGNSLIDDVKVAGEKAFVWEKEFKAIMENGGFDIVIGNPPYVFTRNENFSDDVKKYFYSNFKLSSYQLNTYSLFIEKAYSLSKQNSYIGNIIPNNWMTIDSFENFRHFLLNKTGNIHIVNLHDKVFEDANVNTCTLVFKKSINNAIYLGEYKENKFVFLDVLEKNLFLMSHKNIISIDSIKNENKTNIINKITLQSQPLSCFAQISTGLKSYQKGKGKPAQVEEIVKNRAFHSSVAKNETFKKYLSGSNVSRYCLTWNEEYLSYGEWLAEPRLSVPFDKERILVRQIPSLFPRSINAIYTNEFYLNDINSMVIFDFKINPKFLLALLNSKLMSFWFIYTFDKLQRKLFPQFKVNELKFFPIINSDNNKLINLVDYIMLQNKNLQTQITVFLNFINAEFKPQKISSKLHRYYELDWLEFKAELKKGKVDLDKFDLKKRREWQAEFEREKQKALAIKQIIDQTDNAIDSMVYALYGLDEADIAMINQGG